MVAESFVNLSLRISDRGLAARRNRNPRLHKLSKPRTACRPAKYAKRREKDSFFFSRLFASFAGNLSLTSSASFDQCYQHDAPPELCSLDFDRVFRVPFFVCLRVSSWFQSTAEFLKPLTHTNAHEQNDTRTQNRLKYHIQISFAPLLIPNAQS